MTARQKANANEPKSVVLDAHAEETAAETMTRALTLPFLRHGIVAVSITEKMLGKLPDEPSIGDHSKYIKAEATKTGKGDLKLASAMLTAQALSLDALFTELARRATMNMGEYVQSSERYARLAFKAQSNCRATLEALAKLHQPREQTVRHVHVNEGGQAVIADQFHHHTGGQENAKSAKQPYEQGASGSAMLSQDPQGNGVSLASHERTEAM